MKKYFWAFFILISLNSYALEIQCKTNFDTVDAVIKTSEDSGLTYLLLMSGDSVSPIPLNNNPIQVNESLFNYKDSQLNLSIDRKELKGSLTFSDGTKADLLNCEEY